MNGQNKYTDRPLEDPDLKRNPFSVPEGYFSQMEESVRQAISSEKETAEALPKGTAMLKPALMLAAMFLIVAGLGLGVVKLTDVMYQPEQQEEPHEGIYALIEEGYLEHDFIDDYYAEINFEEMLEQNKQ